MTKIPVSLDDLKTAWLQRRYTVQAAMPGLNNELGSIQIEADIAAIKHPLFPPYSGGGEVTGITLLNGRNLSVITENIQIRWRSYMVERKCSAAGFGLESRTFLLPDRPGPAAGFSGDGQYAGICRLLRPGEVFSVDLLFTFCDSAIEAESLAQKWILKPDEAFAGIKAYWEELWEAAFTPDNGIFSGFLPIN